MCTPIESSGRYSASPKFVVWFSVRTHRNRVEPHSSIGSVADLRTGGRWFDPRFGKYSFRGLITVIATGFIPLSPLSVTSTMVMWESSQWLGKNID